MRDIFADGIEPEPRRPSTHRECHSEETVVVVGHVASLTLTVASLCGLWDTPLPHAAPFVVEWDGRSWHCPNSSDRGKPFSSVYGCGDRRRHPECMSPSVRDH
ncbi:hypothetical protein ACIA8C_25085 [Nocardia sp. NPDC051321]|uniref:hypothetical protein n=1 Tax=Nocardia sp. NPDC051321 TaxID=3364323 RepID=UPI003799913B